MKIDQISTSHLEDIDQVLVALSFYSIGAFWPPRLWSMLAIDTLADSRLLRSLDVASCMSMLVIVNSPAFYLFLCQSQCFTTFSLSYSLTPFINIFIYN